MGFSDLIKNIPTKIGSPALSNDFFTGLLIKKGIEENVPVYIHSLTGVLRKENFRSVIQLFENNSFKSVTRYGSISSPHYVNFLKDYTYINLSFNLKDKNIVFSVASLSEEDFVKSQLLFKEVAEKNPNLSGSIYMITRQRDGSLDLTHIGKLQSNFISDNYDPKIVEAYNYIKNQLVVKNPLGRLIILQGKPGTGKSYFIRGLVAESDVESILIPTNLTGQLTGPDLVSCLMDYRQDEAKQKPTLLIIEDADSALIKRDSVRSNLSTLSDILNMSDGLLGDFADLRILCTTNTARVELDPAVMRSGRLCAHVEFDFLSPEICKSIYKRITGTEKTFTQPISLADIYAKANGIESTKSAESIPLGGNFI